MSALRTLICERHGATEILTLDQPTALNRLNRAMVAERTYRWLARLDRRRWPSRIGSKS